jgi:hypothetical protein
MTTFYSDEMTKVLAVPPVALSLVEHHSKVRFAKVTYLQVAAGDAGDLIQLCKLPAGRVRLIGRLSNLYMNLTTATQFVDMGWAAYVGLDGVAVDADPDGLDDNVDLESAATVLVGTVAAVLAVGGNKLFESQEGVVITLTCVEIPAENDTIDGFIAYVLD